MPKVEGVSAIQKALQRASERFVSPLAVGGESVIVGYTANYALYVHENLKAHHNVGQAKFLEQPAREKALEIAERIVDSMAGGARLHDAIVVGAQLLQRESQALCPVGPTGNLKASAFTRKE